jgi:hypothetical protein
MRTIIVLAFAVLAGSATFAEQDVGDPIAAALAREVRAKYASMAQLSFNLTVQQGGIRRGGAPVPFVELQRTKVWMRPEQVRIDAFLPGVETPFLTYLDDGRKITQWTAKEWDEQTSSSIPYLGRTVHAGRGESDGCFFGSWLSTWLGERSEPMTRTVDRIRRSRYVGIDSVDRRPCHVVLFESVRSETFLVREMLHIEVESHLILRRKNGQLTLSPSGEIEQDVTRIQTMSDLCFDTIDESIFKASVPPTARRIEPPK